MFSHDELQSLYDFLKHTGEGNLRKMLVGGKMSDGHLRILLKMVRGTSVADFMEHFEKETLPKMNYSAAETALKEHFWPICRDVFINRGLITGSSAQKAA